jgi:hypothetical protein
MWLNPHEVVGRAALVLALAGISVDLLTPEPPKQLTGQQIQKIGKDRSRAKAQAKIEARRQQKLLKQQRKKNVSNKVNPTGDSTRCNRNDRKDCGRSNQK